MLARAVPYHPGDSAEPSRTPIPTGPSRCYPCGFTMLSLHRIQPGIAARRGLLLAACAVLGACVLPTYDVTGGAGGGATSTGGTGGATSTLAGGGGTGGATTTSSTGGAGGAGGAGGTGGSTGTSIDCPGMECVGWVHTYGESSVTYGLAVDANEKGVLVGGAFTGSVNLDGMAAISSKGAQDGYGLQTGLAGDHQGSISFAAAAGEATDQVVTAVAYGVDVGGVTDGSTLLAGSFEGSIQLVPGVSISGAVGRDGFAAKFVNGVVDWAISIKSSGDDAVKAVAVTETGEIIVAGTFFDDGTAEIGEDTAPTLGLNSVEAFVLKLSPTGMPMWLRTFGGDGNDDDIDDVIVDGQGGVVVVGSYRNQVYLDGGSSVPPLQGSDAVDGFAMRFQPNGAYHWARGFGGPGSQRVRGAAAGPGDTLYLAGHFNDSLNLGNDTIPEDPANIVGHPDLFLIQTDINGQNTLWKRALWNVKFSGPVALDVAPDGSLGVACSINDDVIDLGGGNMVTPDGTDTLAVRFDAAHALQRYKLVSGTGYQIVNGGVFDPTGAFVLTGNLAGGLDLGYGDISVLTQGEIDAFVLKLDL